MGRKGTYATLPYMRNAMQYMLLIYSEEGAWNRMTPARQEEGTAAFMAYSEALRKAGALVDANRLHDSPDATTVTVVDGRTQVADGPFADTKEQLGGYYLIEAKDLDEAITWAARCPGASFGKMEVRPVWAMA